jgi:uncharacterized protein YacL
MFNIENGVFTKYLKLLVPLVLNIVFAFTGGRFGEKYFDEHMSENTSVILDTGVLIDGRISELCKLPMFEGRCLIPDFVIDELRVLSDSHDELKRKKGRSGLELVERLQKEGSVSVSGTDIEYSAGSTDDDLIKICRDQNNILMTTDYNLSKKAAIEGAVTLFMKDLEKALRPRIISGDIFDIELIRRGKEKEQAVGYLEDGTMIVAQNGVDHIGQVVKVEVENIVQTSAGKIIFVNVIPES